MSIMKFIENDLLDVESIKNERRKETKANKSAKKKDVLQSSSSTKQGWNTKE